MLCGNCRKKARIPTRYILIWTDWAICLTAIILIFRTRELTLLACNFKWDKDNKIDEIIDKYLKHITDVKPITARQCIKLLPTIAENKPELKDNIVSALQKADISFYDDSMQPLIYKDIQKSLKEIQKL